MTARAEKQRQEPIECSCIEAVAEVTGCKAIREDEANQWPDGWLEEIADDLRSALGQIEDILGDLQQRRL